MTENKKQTDSLNQMHDQIMDRISKEKPERKWQVLFKTYCQTIAATLLILCSSVFFIWFVNNLINNRLLLQPSLIDLSGIEWVWSPEIFGLAVLLYFIGISLQKSILDTTLKFAGLGTVFASALFINIIFFTPTTQAFQSNIQANYNKLGYRIFSRDNHINVLISKDTFYGVVTKQDLQTGIMEIDHGGVVKQFKTKNAIVNLLNLPVKISFMPVNNELIVSNVQILN